MAETRSRPSLAEPSQGPSRSARSLRNRKRAAIACISCRSRKVRCDVQFRNGACTNCSLDGQECHVQSMRTRVMGRPEGQSPIPNSPSSDESSGKIRYLPIRPADTLEQSDACRAHTPISQSMEMVPEKLLRQHLVRCYSRYVHPRLPVMTISDLAEIIDMKPQSPYYGTFVMNALFSISAKYAQEDILREFGFRCKYDACSVFFSRAKDLLCVELTRRTYSTIQGLLLMSSSERATTDIWFLLGLAHTICITIRLDEDTACIAQPERGLRKRLWWSLYSQLNMLAINMDEKPRFRIKRISLLCINDFENDIPDAFHTHVNDLEIIPALETWSRMGHNFVRHLELLRLYDECSEWREVPQRASGLMIRTAELTRSLLNSGIGWESERKTLDAEETRGTGDSANTGVFYLSPLDRAENTNRSWFPEADGETDATLLDIERLLFNPA